jgi:hypothetical protein
MGRLALCLVLQEIGGHPDNTLPGGGGGGTQLPSFPGMGGGGIHYPDHSLPGGGGGGTQLPSRPGSGGGGIHHPIVKPPKPYPPGFSPGPGMWVIAYVPQQGWKWVAITPGVPEKPQPTPPPDPANPDQTLPGVPGEPPTATPV